MASVPTQASLTVKFHPPKSFRFPKRKFGTKTERLFRAEWCGAVRTIIIHGSTTTSVPIRPSVTFVLYDSSI